MREFNVQDRITLSAQLAAGAMSVAAEPRDTATVEVLPFDESAASREAAERTLVELRGSTLHVESPKGAGWWLRRSGRIRVDVRLPEDSQLIINLASAEAFFFNDTATTEIYTASG